MQQAKKVMLHSLELVDFAIRLVNSVLHLPSGQMNFFTKFTLQKNCNQSCSSKVFFRLIKMTLSLQVSCSLPNWQAVKLTFSAP